MKKFAYIIPLLFAVSLSLIACENDAIEDTGEGDNPEEHETQIEEPVRFAAEMVPENVVSGSPEQDSDARAHATAILHGDTLTVHGAFTGLSSQLRDIEDTPDDPGIHIHPGEEGEENSYIYGLEADLNDDERSGTFYGTFELSDEEVAMLAEGRLYMDIHTVDHDPGEVRDQLRPVDAQQGQDLSSSLPVNGNELTAEDVGAVACPNGVAECHCHETDGPIAKNVSLD